MSAEIRPYEDRDFDDVARQRREVGWLDESEGQLNGHRAIMDSGSGFVGVVNGEAEANAHWVTGSLRHVETDLPMCVVTSVTTTPVARQHRFASRLTALAVAAAAESGHVVASLGIFDQGFYDRLGFGTGPYDFRATFDPAALVVDVPSRTPVRVGLEDHAEISDLMARRHRGHGSVVLPAGMAEAELSFAEKGLGLGFRNDEGRLTHFFFVELGGEYSTKLVRLMGYESPEQLIELLGTIKAMSDQWVSVRMMEPQEICLQDLIRRPFRERQKSGGGEHATGVDARAVFQWRMLDVVACLSTVRWPGESVGFNVVVSDPIVDHLDGEWAGVAGDYLVNLGDETSVSRGSDPGLDTVTCSVNELTRMWLGSASASSMALVGGFDAPRALLGRLDDAFRVPRPVVGWDY